MRRGTYQFKVPASHWRRQPRATGGGRQRLVPAEKRAILYALMKKQQDTEREINAMLDSCYPEGQSIATGRNRAAILRRIYVEKGR